MASIDQQQFNSRIRLRHLQCFVAVAQEQHLRKAAERLHLSQPAVSKTLAELEELVGARLMDRGRFGARLTRDGQSFLDHALSVLEALEGARRAVQDDGQGAHETVMVGALPTVAPDLLPEALVLFRRVWPQVRVDVQIGANAPLLDKLRSGEVDFVLGRMADPAAVAGLSFELLYVEPLVAVARAEHPLLAEPDPALHRIVEYPLIVSTRGTVPRHNTESFLRSRGLGLPSNCLETLSVSVARLVAMGTDSVWFTPMGAVREDVLNGSLVRLSVITEGTEEPVGLLRRSDAQLGQCATSLMKMLRETAEQRRAARRDWKIPG
ncbi:pca operon transcription factor PcaQ [Pusillimonas sp.]|uniref:pca operon transcription factor PcaQ n=1 Tax=Pusillimonas sp. TaxID=3040095 RepID=UPI0037C677E5